jgi:hypothetical protein
MHAPYAFDSDPFADPFEEALASRPAGAEGAAVAAYAPAETRTMARPRSDVRMAPVADALRQAGFTQASIAVARLDGDERAAAWTGLATADAALATVIATHGSIGIPSVQLREDGTPRFVVCGDDAHALVAQFADEHGDRGVDAELRLFLDEALQAGDRFVDARPGAGFAALTAATRAGVAVVALVDDTRDGDALHRSARASGCDAAVTVRHIGDAGALAFGAHDGLTVLHAGHAANVAVLLQAMRAQAGAAAVDAVAWRCGTTRDADYDPEGMQVAAAVLGVLGFRHFALAVGTDGVELVPAEAMASNAMIFSLAEAFLARAGG